MNLKEENEELRDLLRRVYNYVPISDQIRIDSALSHQAEPAPAQDERQPTAVPEGWLIELGFGVLDRPFRFVDSKSHTPTIKVILPPCEPDDSSSWDLRDEIARCIGSVLSARPAQTEQQPEQSEMVTIHRWILERFLEVDEALDEQGRTIENLTNYDTAVGCIRRALSAPIAQTAPQATKEENKI